MKGFNLFSQETDLQAEEKGIWADYLDNGEVVGKVLVARANNVEYARLMSSLYEKHRQVIEAGLNTTDDDKIRRADEISREIDKKCFTRHIIKGWKGFTDENGKEFKFSIKNAELVYDRLTEFVRQVKLISSDENNYRLSAIKKDAEALKK